MSFSLKTLPIFYFIFALFQPKGSTQAWSSFNIPFLSTYFITNVDIFRKRQQRRWKGEVFFRQTALRSCI